MVSNLFRRLIHPLEHWFGSNTGSIVSWRDETRVYVAFECDFCKKIDSKTINSIEYSTFAGDEPEYTEEK